MRAPTKSDGIAPYPWRTRAWHGWLLAVLALLVTACGEYSGTEAAAVEAQITSRTSQDQSQTCSTTPTAQTLTPVAQAGAELYAKQCAACHGGAGYGTANGPSMIGCATCGDLDTLTNRIATTMPVGSVQSCGLDCSKKTAEYILAAFNSGFNDFAVQAQSCSVDGITLEAPEKTLYRASLSLAGKLPAEAEVAAVANTDVAALTTAINAYMETDAFYQRVMEIYNDMLHQDKYLPGEEALGLLDNTDYPERRWFANLGLNTSTAGPQRTLYEWLRNETNDAVSEEALRLIAHVVKNNRPFTEILTADYTLANRYSAQVWGVLGQTSFKLLATPVDPAYPEDPEDFREVRIPKIPHAGILTSPMFLNKFPTTATNLNRHRSRKIFEFFLDTDVLAIQGMRPDQSIDLISTTPTLDNPACTGCHDVMDPVASTFQNWDARGRYRPSRLTRDGWPSDIQPRGFNGEVMPLSGNADRSLQWLGKQIAQDPRFARATVKTVFKGFTGEDPLSAPSDDASEAAKSAYVAQRLYLGNIEKEFIESGYNFKTLVRGVLLSPYYRAAEVSGDSAGIMGSARLLTPEMLDRKLKATTGSTWKHSWASYSHFDKERGEFNQLYGGIDSDSIEKRITHPNGLMASLQLRMATEMACEVTARDFYLPPAQRKLFPYVARDSVPYNSDGAPVASAIANIRATIRHLHWTLLGEKLADTDARIDTTYALFEAIWRDGQPLVATKKWQHRYLNSRCDVTEDPVTGEKLPEAQQIREDSSYALRAWMGVMTYLLADYQFLYE